MQEQEKQKLAQEQQKARFRRGAKTSRRQLSECPPPNVESESPRTNRSQNESPRLGKSLVRSINSSYSKMKLYQNYYKTENNRPQEEQTQLKKNQKIELLLHQEKLDTQRDSPRQLYHGSQTERNSSNINFFESQRQKASADSLV